MSGGCALHASAALSDPQQRRAEMSAAMTALGVPDAAQRIYDTVLALV